VACDCNRSLSRKESGDNKATCLEIIAFKCGSVYEKGEEELNLFLLHGL